jgi:hypothetical protein
VESADEAVLNKVRKKYKKSPQKIKKSLNFCAATMETTHTSSSLPIEMDTKPKAIETIEKPPPKYGSVSV